MTYTEPRKTTIFEAKFAVPRHMRERVHSVLEARTLRPERFATARLRTMYFDDTEKTSFFESRNGNLSKRKYRLREYVDPEPGGAFYSIEVKIRSDTMTRKVKRLIYRRLPEDYRPTTFRHLIETFEELTGESLSVLRAELPPDELFPAVAVEYHRARFDDPDGGIRYNIDTGVSVMASNPLVAPSCAMYLNHDIFEIKSKEPCLLPGYLKGFGIEPFSFSKFVWGGEFALEGLEW